MADITSEEPLQDLEHDGSFQDDQEQFSDIENEDLLPIIKSDSKSAIEIISVNQSYDMYYHSSRITKPFLTRFEKAKLLGARSEMLANGAPALINVPAHMTCTYEIAKLEFAQKAIPLMIKRFLPNGSSELWRLEDLSY
jgi:DNA-directed RNA polymerases I, II, and III subunit RPABC2